MKVILLLICVLFFALVFALLRYISSLKQQVEYYKQEEQEQRRMHHSNLLSKRMLVHWIEQKSQKREIADYLQKHEINRIAIYGLAEVGDLLYQELENSQVTVVCGIDKSKLLYDKKVVRPENFQEDVDAIIVTIPYYFSEIYDSLNQKLNGKIPILGLDEIIFEMSV